MDKLRNRIYTIRWSILGLLLLSIFLCRMNPQPGEWYAREVYPTLSVVLGSFSSLVPFSLEELLAIVAGGGLLAYPFIARRRGRKWKTILRNELESVLWLYVWFYWGWGMNYFRESFYTRTRVQRTSYDEVRFRTFLQTYTDSLNASYCPVARLKLEQIHQSIQRQYRLLPSSYGLLVPKKYQTPKSLWCTPLYSGVGVLGYMGPFFNEMQVNEDLLPIQYPFTYAHELSHLLGVSNEAEANFWAYHTCIRSESKEIRYSGYFSLLPYVMVNARAVLSETNYTTWCSTIRNEVVRELEEKQRYWQTRYSPLPGAIQDKIYDLFLKGNRISSGKKNYAEVIQMILSMEESSKCKMGNGRP